MLFATEESRINGVEILRYAQGIMPPCRSEGAFLATEESLPLLGERLANCGRDPSLALRESWWQGLILTRKLLVDPEELLAFVHYADEAAEARVFGFEEGLQLAK